MKDKIEMTKKRTLKIIASFVIITATAVITVRNSTIREHDWKITSGVSLKNDFIH